MDPGDGSSSSSAAAAAATPTPQPAPHHAALPPPPVPHHPALLLQPAPHAALPPQSAPHAAPHHHPHAAGHFLHAKAGMQGVDKEHVARVVEEASRGSKYFDNATAREAKLAARIAEMAAALARRTPAELERATAAMERETARMEAARRLDRVRVVADMDAFFAAVEETHDASLKGVPFAVGGMGMISTASYAARAFGVRSAMPGFIAVKLCPQLRFVKPNYDKYTQTSAAAKAVFLQYDADAHMGSLDEAYLDLTAYLEAHAVELAAEAEAAAAGAAGGAGAAAAPREGGDGDGRSTDSDGEGDSAAAATAGAASSSSSSAAAASASALLPPPTTPAGLAVVERVVGRMRAQVAAATGGCTCSAGIAPNALLAKIVSDQRKPDGQFALPFNAAAIAAFMRPLPVRKLPGVGKVTESQLTGLGFATCADLLARKGALRLALGERASTWLLRCALGVGEEDYPLPGGGSGGGSDAAAAEQLGRKSLSQERTFRDCGAWPELEARARELAAAVAAQLAEEAIVCRTLTVKMKAHTFEVTQRQTVLRRPTADAATLADTAVALLRSAWPVTLRLLGVKASGLAPAAAKPTLLDAFVQHPQQGGGGSGGGEESDGGGSGGEEEDDDEVVVVGGSEGGGGGRFGPPAAASGAKRKRAGGPTSLDAFLARASGGGGGGGGGGSSSSAAAASSSSSSAAAGGDSTIGEIVVIDGDDDSDDDNESGGDDDGGGTDGGGAASGNVTARSGWTSSAAGTPARGAGAGGAYEDDDGVVVLPDSQPAGAEAPAASAAGAAATTSSSSSSAAAGAAAAADDAPRCPICGARFGATARSTEINAHIDGCLGRGSGRGVLRR